MPDSPPPFPWFGNPLILRYFFGENMEILGWFKGYVWVRKISHFFLFFLKCSLPYSCVFFTAQSKEILSRLISNVFQAWCKGLQGVTTYLMLTTYSWMLCEGAYLRFILVRLMQHFEVGVIHPWWYSLTFGRVAKCHRYVKYICVKILEGWGKKCRRPHSCVNWSIFWVNSTNFDVVLSLNQPYSILLAHEEAIYLNFIKK